MRGAGSGENWPFYRDLQLPPSHIMPAILNSEKMQSWGFRAVETESDLIISKFKNKNS